jgi:hypothetical protein
MAASKEDLSQWKGFEWRKKTEAFGDRDEAVVAVGPTGDIEGIWQVEMQYNINWWIGRLLTEYQQKQSTRRINR